MPAHPLLARGAPRVEPVVPARPPQGGRHPCLRRARRGRGAALPNASAPPCRPRPKAGAHWRGWLTIAPEHRHAGCCPKSAGPDYADSDGITSTPSRFRRSAAASAESSAWLALPGRICAITQIGTPPKITWRTCPHTNRYNSPRPTEAPHLSPALSRKGGGSAGRKENPRRAIPRSHGP